jgi:poly(A) polymerase
MEDLMRRKIRMIGDPATRYQEDPVRMLRAVRFAAKLDFTIEAATAKPIAGMADMLSHIPSARLFEEVLKLFMDGYAEPTFRLLSEYGLLPHLFTQTAALLPDHPQAMALILRAMHNTDVRVRNDQRVTPAFVFAAILWPVVVQEQQQLERDGEHPVRAHMVAAQDVLSRQVNQTAIPKRFQQTIREIWELQGRLPLRQGKRAETLFEHPRFRAAYDFLLLREESGENLDGLGAWWTEYQALSPEQREVMVAELRTPARTGTRPARRRRRPSAPRSGQ